MTKERNPQAAQMGDESMVRNLAAQAVAIWPQEAPLFDRYGLTGPIRIADIGCGTGEITSRLAARYPEASIVGVDILDASIAHARRAHAGLAPRVRFEQGDAFHLTFADASFDLVVCRHLTQSIPEPERVLAEMHRVVRRGGWLHVLSEDYAMIHVPAGRVDPDRLWHDAVIVHGRNTGVDDRIGRRTWPLMNALGLTDLHVDYAIVDTVRVPRETFASILAAWRDGYTDVVAEKSGMPRQRVRELFDYIVETIRDPAQYAVWHVPIVSGRRPET